MRTLIKNQIGFTLMEVVMVMGLMGLIAAGSNQMILRQMNASAEVDIKFKEMDLSRRMGLLLANKRSCEETLVNQAVGSSVVTEIKDHRGDVVFEVGRFYEGNKLKIKSIALKNKTIPILGGRGELEFVVNLTRMNGRKEIRSTNKIFTVKVDATRHNGRITSCQTQVDDSLLAAKEEICESLGGEYQDGRCRTKTKIQSRVIAAEEINSRPKTFVSCPADYELTECSINCSDQQLVVQESLEGSQCQLTREVSGVVTYQGRTTRDLGDCFVNAFCQKI